MDKYWFTRSFLLLLSFFSLHNASAQTYFLAGNQYNSSITFDTNENFVIIDRPCDLCQTFGRNDTVSFGKYVNYEDKIYFLFSDPEATSGYLHADVSENVIKPKDSLLFVMSSPLTKPIDDNFNTADNTIIYIINIWYIGKAGDSSRLQNYQKFVTMRDSIFVPGISNKSVEKIQIEIVCNNNSFNAKRSLQYTYKAKNISSNSFVFYFKDVSYNRFFYRNFFYEPVVIIDDNTIDFDRMLFQKRKKKIKRFPNGEIYYDIFAKVKNPYETEEE